MSHVAFPAFILASAINFLVRSKAVKAESFLFYEIDPVVDSALDKDLAIPNRVELLAHIAWSLPSFIVCAFNLGSKGRSSWFFLILPES